MMVTDYRCQLAYERQEGEFLSHCCRSPFITSGLTVKMELESRGIGVSREITELKGCATTLFLAIVFELHSNSKKYSVCPPKCVHTTLTADISFNKLINKH